ncbi:MAG: FkbM family methyltransferase [Mesorhizobium sp.]
MKCIEVRADSIKGSITHNSMHRSQIEKRTVHEDDFLAFGFFKERNCTFFDIGANIGNSAISIHAVQPMWDVISFEPNISLYEYFEEVRILFEKDGSKYTLHQVGLGSESGELDFFIPYIEDWYVIGEASFDFSHFQHPVVRARLSRYSRDGKWTLHRTKLPVVRFDEFGPVQKFLQGLKSEDGLFVKIDVEGFESNVIEGMDFFLRTYRPHLMIENDPSDSIPELMLKKGYSTFAFSKSLNKLMRTDIRENHLNLFYIHKFHLDQGYFDSFILHGV